jgi:nicotinamide-nucleotide amidase
MTSPGKGNSGRELRAEIVTIGTELVQGLIVDTNSAWISRRLASVGVPVDFHTSVGDDEARIEFAVRLAASRSDLVMIAGGLGPTADDITRDMLARIAGKKLVLHQPSLDLIASMFARWGRQMTENNKTQAFLPEGSEVIENHNGTAPGFCMKIGRAEVQVFPGVPHELYAMVDEFTIPRIRAAQVVPGVIKMRRLLCFGPGESAIDQKVRHLMALDRNPNVGLLVHDYVITVKITAHGSSEPEADAMIAKDEKDVRAILGDIIFGVDDERMSDVAARELIRRRLKIAIAESCTGGMIAGMLTDVSGVSAAFLAGVVSYSNESKQDFLGVPAELIAKHGAVSEAVARAMAEGMLKRTGADVAVGVTGIAGPTGGTAEKPVGLVYIARADAKSTEVRECRFSGSRDRIRVRSAVTALDMVRRWALTATARGK